MEQLSNRQLEISVEKIFDNYSKWDAFLYLTRNKDQIRRIWFEKLQNKLYNYYNSTGKKIGWGINKLEDASLSWYLEEFGYKSIGIQFRFWGALILYCNDSSINVPIAFNELQKDYYQDLIDIFYPENIIKNERILLELRSYEFKNSEETRLPADELSWYANFNTDEFFDLICKKISLLQSDQICSKIRELNLNSGISSIL